MKAEELIRNNALTDITVCEGQKVVAVEIALTALNMARMEEGKRAIEIFGLFMGCCGFNEDERSKYENAYMDVLKKQQEENNL